MMGVTYESRRAWLQQFNTWLQQLHAWLQRFQWTRGVRAAAVVGSALLVCHMLGKPLAAAALGAFNPLLVDNGGPYRTRLTTMTTALLGGTFAFVLGSTMPSTLIVVILVTMLVCFTATFARVLSQPIASSSVLMIVSYFAGLGGVRHSFTGAFYSVELLLLGGLWAILLSLIFWPLDPFRPARLAVSGCYASLAELTTELVTHIDDEDEEKAANLAHEGRRKHRLRVEEARSALAATSARAPSRTSRARNLAVLLETSDMLFARNIRLTELAELSSGAGEAAVHVRIAELASWLAAAERAIGEALLHRPADEGASFAPEGSHRVQWITRRRRALEQQEATPSNSILEHLLTEERDALLEMTVAFDSVRSIWTGTQIPQTFTQDLQELSGEKQARAWGLGSQSSGSAGSGLVSSGAVTSDWIGPGWTEALHANWTLDSAMLRHALRLMVVGAVDVVVMRLIHVNHGFWLPMTSMILMQPYSAGTARKSVQRVTGSVLGGIFAAVLAATVPDVPVMIVVLTLLSGFTLATFAVDYALYCFFLTPTFVLISLPYPHDWHYAGIRIGTTLAGALIAVTAMRLLWPERAEVELGRLLRRGAAADAAYIRALLLFWEIAPSNRRAGEREILAPARRACGLASNDAEEAVDRVMQEPHLPLRSPWNDGDPAPTHPPLIEQALTFATYLRRLTQSITTLAFIGRDANVGHDRLVSVAERLERISSEHGVTALPRYELQAFSPLQEERVADMQLQRMERQAGVLERIADKLVLNQTPT